MINFSTLFRSLAAVLLIATTPVAHATTVTYGSQNLGGNTWEYSFTVSNDSLGFAIEEFSVYFDVGDFENLAVTTTPTDWDPVVFQPEPSLPDDGLYDALALVSGIAAGASLGGFGVQFDYLGAGSPGDLFFEVIDPFTFDVLDSGFTQAAAVPLPAAAWLFFSGLLGLAGLGRRRPRT